jgi:hypothetical protein
VKARYDGAYILVIPTLKKLRQNCKFQASLGYIVRSCLKRKKPKKLKAKSKQVQCEHICRHVLELDKVTLNFT